MADADDDLQPGKISFTIQQILANTYGPYLFGLVSFCVTWYIAVAPQLEAMRLDFQSQRDITQQMNDVHLQQNALATTMRITADALERSVDKLVKAEARGTTSD